MLGCLHMSPGSITYLLRKLGQVVFILWKTQFLLCIAGDTLPTFEKSQCFLPTVLLLPYTKQALLSVSYTLLTPLWNGWQTCLLCRIGGDRGNGLLLWGLLGPKYQETVVFVAHGTACLFILDPTLAAVLDNRSQSEVWLLFVCGLIHGKPFQTACL